MADRYSQFTTSPVSPASGAFAVIPHDSEALPQTTRALYVGSGGDVAVEMHWGGMATFANVPDGTLLPVRVSKVLTATSAAQIVGLY